MITIEQGANTPIICEFKQDYTAAAAFSASLFCLGTTLKHWSKADITFSGYNAVLPLTEAETLQFTACPAKLSVKFLDADNNVIFCDEEKVRIIYKHDKTALISTGA